MLSSGHDTAIALMRSQQLWSPADDQDSTAADISAGSTKDSNKAGRHVGVGSRKVRGRVWAGCGRDTLLGVWNC